MLKKKIMVQRQSTPHAPHFGETFLVIKSHRMNSIDGRRGDRTILFTCFFILIFKLVATHIHTDTTDEVVTDNHACDTKKPTHYKELNIIRHPW